MEDKLDLVDNCQQFRLSHNDSVELHLADFDFITALAKLQASYFAINANI